jgi:hypothetical protein
MCREFTSLIALAQFKGQFRLDINSRLATIATVQLRGL